MHCSGPDLVDKGAGLDTLDAVNEMAVEVGQLLQRPDIAKHACPLLLNLAVWWILEKKAAQINKGFSVLFVPFWRNSCDEQIGFFPGNVDCLVPETRTQ